MKGLNSLFIGTGIGASFNHFGDVDLTTYEIDGVEYRILTSFKYFYLNDNYELDSVHTKEELRKLNKDKFKLKIFKPDIYIKENIDAIRKGRDLYLEALDKYIKDTTNIKNWMIVKGIIKEKRGKSC